MDIIILLKQVPDTETLVQIDTNGISVKTENIKWVMNPYDELAVEEALRIKADHGGTVTALSLGPQRSVEAIRTSLAMGVDKGVLIKDDSLAGRDALGTALILATAIKEIPFDLIIAGQRAVDNDNGQVGSAVAEFLDIPLVSMVVETSVTPDKIICTRETEGGTMNIEMDLPGLFTAQRGLNEPRYASLPGILKAKKKPLEIKNLTDFALSAEDLEPNQAKARIIALKTPLARKPCKIISAESCQEKAATLVTLLHEEAKVL